GVRTPASTSSTHAATCDATRPPLGTGIPRRGRLAAAPLVRTASFMTRPLPRAARRPRAAPPVPRPAATPPGPPTAPPRLPGARRGGARPRRPRGRGPGGRPPPRRPAQLPLPALAAGVGEDDALALGVQAEAPAAHLPGHVERRPRQPLARQLQRVGLHPRLQ